MFARGPRCLARIYIEFLSVAFQPGSSIPAPRRPTLTRGKSRAANLHPEEILARADAERLDGARTGGSNGVFQEGTRVACGDISVWHGLARICQQLGGGPGGHSLRLFTQVHSDEAFGLYTTPVISGGLLRKWLGVAHKLEDERVQLALCDGDRERCVSEAALKFLRIVDSGRRRDGRAPDR